MLEVEASLGSEEALTELSGELAQLRKRNEALGNELRSRGDEIEALRAGISGGPHGDALKVTPSIPERHDRSPETTQYP